MRKWTARSSDCSTLSAGSEAMKSGDPRPARGQPGPREAQGSLEGILSPEESRVEKKADAAAGPEPAMKSGRKKPSRPRPGDAQERGSDSLRASLDALEENVTLLLARHESLAAANAVAEERRLSRDSLDPVELERRVRLLEAERERLERHAAFLEGRIRGLLSRVRYVIES
jgi:hypothetical protein